MIHRKHVLMKFGLRYIILLALIFMPLMGFAQKSGVKKQLKKYKKAGVEKPVSSHKVQPDAVITTAKSFLGTKHKMGGTSQAGLDCSGLIMVSFSKHGIKLPRVSSDQGRYGKQITSISRLRKGDLVFFHMNWNRKRLVNHVGIYIGKGQFIHVSSSKGCMVSSIQSKVWQSGFLFGTRVW